MARTSTGYYKAIEYVGPRPRKPKKPNFFGGWVIVVFTLAAIFYFVRPLVSQALASQVAPSGQEAEEVIRRLESIGGRGNELAAAALRYSGRDVVHDRAYYKIEYPGGDVPADKGVAADLVIRSFRQTGIDLQKDLHEDISESFRLYPQFWSATGPDTNIDHRRVHNLQRFFSRNGTVLTTEREVLEYAPGDVVVWALPSAKTHVADTHIGIVVPGPDMDAEEPWVVHHPVGGPVKWESALLDYQILGHFRYGGKK